MKFQKKIMFSYIIFSIAVISVFSISYYRLSVKEYKEKEYNNMRAVADVKVQQFEDMLKEMERVSTYLLSEKDVLDALSSLAKNREGESYEILYFDQASSTVRSSLNRDYLITQFYRVVIFNRNNVVIANNNNSEKKLNQNITYKDIPWLQKVSGTKGRGMVIGIHPDDWGERDSPEILSLVTEIQGEDRGYIEVQQTKEHIDEIMKNETMNMDYLLFSTGSGELLYASDEGIDIQRYWASVNREDGSIREAESEDGEQQILLERQLFRQEITLIAVNHADVTGEIVQQILPLTLLMFLGFMALAFSYVYFTSRQLSRPIKQLQKYMEETQLDNLEHEMPEKISNDEFEILYGSYKDVLSRLQNSMIEERRMSTLQLQAQFDLLQAQVNPHFIYNVLNVISNRGMMDDDEVICDICSDLAGMLRYSTNTKEKYASVREEVEYLKQYLSLLKYRYDYRLTYSIEIDEILMQNLMPKIILQQIVENSIAHGYAHSTGIIEIAVAGWRDDGGWEIIIHDNGCGIDKEALIGIKNAITDIRHKLTKNREHVEMEIGGMGLINTYARLYLLHNERLKFQIISEPGNGTDVMIRIEDGEENGTVI